MAEEKVAREVAEDEFARWATMMDVELDVSDMDEDEVELTNGFRNTLVDAIAKGRLSVEEDGRATVHTKEGFDLTFREPTFKDIAIVSNGGKGKAGDTMARFICSLTSAPSKHIHQLRRADTSLVMAVAGFLAPR